MIGTYHTTDYKMEQQNFVDGRTLAAHPRSWYNSR